MNYITQSQPVLRCFEYEGKCKSAFLKVVDFANHSVYRLLNHPKVTLTFKDQTLVDFTEQEYQKFKYEKGLWLAISLVTLPILLFTLPAKLASRENRQIFSQYTQLKIQKQEAAKEAAKAEQQRKAAEREAAAAPAEENVVQRSSKAVTDIFVTIDQHPFWRTPAGRLLKPLLPRITEIPCLVTQQAMNQTVKLATKGMTIFITGACAAACGLDPTALMGDVNLALAAEKIAKEL